MNILFTSGLLIGYTIGAIFSQVGPAPKLLIVLLIIFSSIFGTIAYQQ